MLVLFGGAEARGPANPWKTMKFLKCHEVSWFYDKIMKTSKILWFTIPERKWPPEINRIPIGIQYISHTGRNRSRFHQFPWFSMKKHDFIEFHEIQWFFIIPWFLQKMLQARPPAGNGCNSYAISTISEVRNQIKC